MKFDFFFFLGFAIQFLVIVTNIDLGEKILTIAAIPITILILLGAAWATRRENLIGMVVTIVLYFCGAAYFIFKLVRMYQTGYENAYKPVRKNLTSFAVITLLLVVLTITNAIMCSMNFNKGLKQHVSKRKILSEEDKAEQIDLSESHHGKGPTNRMTID